MKKSMRTVIQLGTIAAFVLFGQSGQGQTRTHSTTNATLSAREMAINERWAAYSLTEPNVQAARRQLGQLYPLQVKLTQQVALLRKVALSKDTKAAYNAARDQADNVSAQLSKVDGDIAKLKRSIEQVKLNWLVTVEPTLPR